MENNELQKIWKNIDKEIDRKSEIELNLLLTSKAKQTINKFLGILFISLIVCISVLIYVTITAINRIDDTIYVINNIVLAFVTLLSLVSGLYLWYKMQTNKYNLPLKNWLEIRIKLLSKGLTGRFCKLYLVTIPFIYILVVLSIHVYFENKLFVDVLNTEESVIGLLVGSIIGLSVSYFAAWKIRKFQLSNLEFLNDLYARIENENCSS